MNIVGLDLSLTATGVSSRGRVHTIRVKLPKHATELQRIHRLHTLVAKVDVAVRHADVVVLEDYAFSRADAFAHALGELGGCVKVVLFQRGIPFVVIGPSKLKKFATGKGNAPKDLVLAQAVKRFGFTMNNNEADALWLENMGHVAYATPYRIVVPQVNETALQGIEWPEIPARKGEAVG